MAEFYAPKPAIVKLPSGRTLRLRWGIQTLPDEFANSHLAHQYGVKPTSEMTDAQWRALGLTPPVAPAPAPALAATAADSASSEPSAVPSSITAPVTAPARTP